MTITKTLLHARKLLVVAATVVAATCVASGSPADTTADHSRPALHQATKEWRSGPSSADDAVVATKEWKVAPLKTKEW